MKLPEKIEIVRYGRKFTFKVDGVDFPYAVADGGISADLGESGGCPCVHITLLAEEVSVLDSLKRGLDA